MQDPATQFSALLLMSRLERLDLLPKSLERDSRCRRGFLNGREGELHVDGKEEKMDGERETRNVLWIRAPA